MRFLMPGFPADEKTLNTFIRKPIERDHSTDARIALNRRASPLILRRTRDQVATELPEKTTLIHGIDLAPKQTDLYESVPAAMDVRVREAIADNGLAKSHIIVLDALLKLRQICCHPHLLKSEAVQRVTEAMLAAASNSPAIKARTDFYLHRVPEEFYDLSNDRCERTNLIGDPLRQAEIEAMRQELLALMRRAGDPFRACGPPHSSPDVQSVLAKNVLLPGHVLHASDITAS